MILATPRYDTKTYMLDHPDEITTFLMEEDVYFEEAVLGLILHDSEFFVFGRDALLVSDSDWEMRLIDDIYEEYLLG